MTESFSYPADLKGQIALVTGAAQGLGQGMAQVCFAGTFSAQQSDSRDQTDSFILSCHVRQPIQLMPKKIVYSKTVSHKLL
jgi:hypothetical protein